MTFPSPFFAPRSSEIGQEFPLHPFLRSLCFRRLASYNEILHTTPTQSREYPKSAIAISMPSGFKKMRKRLQPKRNRDESNDASYSPNRATFLDDPSSPSDSLTTSSSDTLSTPSTLVSPGSFETAVSSPPEISSPPDAIVTSSSSSTINAGVRRRVAIPKGRRRAPGEPSEVALDVTSPSSSSPSSSYYSSSDSLETTVETAQSQSNTSIGRQRRAREESRSGGTARRQALPRPDGKASEGRLPRKKNRASQLRTPAASTPKDQDSVPILEAPSPARRKALLKRDGRKAKVETGTREPPGSEMPIHGRRQGKINRQTVPMEEKNTGPIELDSQSIDISRYHAHSSGSSVQEDARYTGPYELDGQSKAVNQPRHSKSSLSNSRQELGNNTIKREPVPTKPQFERSRSLSPPHERECPPYPLTEEEERSWVAGVEGSEAFLPNSGDPPIEGDDASYEWVMQTQDGPRIIPKILMPGGGRRMQSDPSGNWMRRKPGDLARVIDQSTARNIARRESERPSGSGSRLQKETEEQLLDPKIMFLEIPADKADAGWSATDKKRRKARNSRESAEPPVPPKVSEEDGFDPPYPLL